MTEVIHSWRAERQGNNVDNRIFHSMLCYDLLKIEAFILKLYVTIMLPTFVQLKALSSKRCCNPLSTPSSCAVSGIYG